MFLQKTLKHNVSVFPHFSKVLTEVWFFMWCKKVSRTVTVECDLQSLGTRTSSCPIKNHTEQTPPTLWCQHGDKDPHLLTWWDTWNTHSTHTSVEQSLSTDTKIWLWTLSSFSTVLSVNVSNSCVTHVSVYCVNTSRWGLFLMKTKVKTSKIKILNQEICDGPLCSLVLLTSWPSSGSLLTQKGLSVLVLFSLSEQGWLLFWMLVFLTPTISHDFVWKHDVLHPLSPSVCVYNAPSMQIFTFVF